MKNEEERKQTMEEARDYLVKVFDAAEAEGYKADFVVSLLPFIPMDGLDRVKDLFQAYDTELDAACWRKLCENVKGGKVTIIMN